MEKTTGCYHFSNCSLCPRQCHADRMGSAQGVCQVSSTLKVARAALHFWEEPCISGTNGSGAVFFSGCPLHCIYCQNEEISHGLCGKEISNERLSEIFLELQEKGANNINLVTPTHYVPPIVAAVERARGQGLTLPVVYNTSGYESVDNLKRLEGIVDVYLPDFKYMDSKLAASYSHAPDYPGVAKAALAEMVRQQPAALFYPEPKRQQTKENTDNEHCSCHLPELYGEYSSEAEEGYLIHKGVIVRQLLLPGALKDAKAIVRYLHSTYGNQIYLSLMSQYTPLSHIKGVEPLNRKVKKAEYNAYVDYCLDIGVEHGFIQEGDVAEESFIPYFDCEGV